MLPVYVLVIIVGLAASSVAISELTLTHYIKKNQPDLYNKLVTERSLIDYLSAGPPEVKSFIDEKKALLSQAVRFDDKVKYLQLFWKISHIFCLLVLVYFYFSIIFNVILSPLPK